MTFSDKKPCKLKNPWNFLSKKSVLNREPCWLKPCYPGSPCIGSFPFLNISNQFQLHQTKLCDAGICHLQPKDYLHLLPPWTKRVMLIFEQNFAFPVIVYIIRNSFCPQNINLRLVSITRPSLEWELLEKNMIDEILDLKLNYWKKVFFFYPFIYVLVMKKLEIEKTKPTFIISVLKVAF